MEGILDCRCIRTRRTFIWINYEHFRLTYALRDVCGKEPVSEHYVQSKTCRKTITCRIIIVITTSWTELTPTIISAVTLLSVRLKDKTKTAILRGIKRCWVYILRSNCISMKTWKEHCTVEGLLHSTQKYHCSCISITVASETIL